MFESTFGSEKAKLFFFIKTIRVIRGLEHFNVSVMMDNIKDSDIKKMEENIKLNP
jgi:hypothetical protein